jgi:aspartate 1-decarboxylase
MLKSKIHRATVTGCDPDVNAGDRVIVASFVDSPLASEASL